DRRWGVHPRGALPGAVRAAGRARERPGVHGGGGRRDVVCGHDPARHGRPVGDVGHAHGLPRRRPARGLPLPRRHPEAGLAAGLWRRGVPQPRRQAPHPSRDHLYARLRPGGGLTPVILAPMSSPKPAIELFAPPHPAAVLDVIGTVFEEYGMSFDPSDFDADLLDIPRNYADRGGWFSVLTDAGRVVGTVAAVPKDAAACEIKRLYLLPQYRGRGLGRALMEHILDQVREAGFREAVAWSDVRLETAHQVYDRLGFERIGEREIDDIDQSHELGFLKRF